MFVIDPGGIDDGGRVSIAVQRENAIRQRVVNNGVCIFGGGDSLKALERFRIKHGHGLIVSSRRKPMTRSARDGRTMRAVNAGQFAQQASFPFIDDHNAILPCDEEPVIRRIGNNIVPASIATQRVGMSDPIGGLALRQQQSAANKMSNADATFIFLLYQELYLNWGSRATRTERRIIQGIEAGRSSAESAT